MSAPLERALAMASLTPPVAVGPAKRVGKAKRPTTPNGFYDFSTDPDTIRALFEKYPGNEFAVWPGASGILIEDIDVGVDNGFNTLASRDVAWESKLSYNTPSGGQHHVFPAPSEGAPGPAAPIGDFLGVDRRSGDSVCLWYGPVPTQEQWTEMLAQETPEWLLGSGKRRTSNTALRSAVQTEIASADDVKAWLDGLIGGTTVIADLIVSTDHYGDLVGALANLVEYTRMYPQEPGTKDTFEYLAAGYLNSPVATTPAEERPRKVTDIIRWALGKTAHVQDHTGAMEWAKETAARAYLQANRDAEVAAVVEANALGWEPEDFEDVLNGTFLMSEPTELMREDGIHLFYPASVNELHGASESGKSWIALIAALQCVRGGRHVRYLDYESARNIVVSRLLALGADKDALRQYFHYYRPEARPSTTVASFEYFKKLAEEPASLIVVDGVTEALSQSGLSQKENDDIPKFMAEIPKLLAKATGAAVVIIDHIAKATGDDARHALGAQHKLAAIDGASYFVDVDVQPAKGRVGTLIMKVAKDRNSFVRQYSDQSGSGRMAITAEVELDSTHGEGRTTWRVKSFDNSRALAKAAKVHHSDLESIWMLYAESKAFRSAAQVKAAYRAKYATEIDSKKLNPLLEELEMAGRITVDRSGPAQSGYPSKLAE